MHIPIEYDPAQHQLLDLPVTRFLRRETGQPGLITYRHRIHGTFVVALRASNPSDDTNVMAEIGMLGDGDGKSPGCTRENALSIIRKLADAEDRVKIRKRLRRWRRDFIEQALAEGRDYKEAVRDIYLKQKSAHGPLVAEDWARGAGVPSAMNRQEMDDG